MSRYFYLLLLIITTIVFIPALDGEFLNWDDTVYVTGNEILKEDIGITSFLKLYKFDSNISLTLFSFQLQIKIFGSNPQYFHFFNILIHLINVFLVFYLINVLFKDRNSAFWIALIFAVHPFKVESVAWIIQRKDLLYTMFFLSGIITYVRFLKTNKILWYLLTLIFAYLSIISKVAAISLVFALLSIEYYIQNRIMIKSILLIFIIGFIQLSNINSVLIVFVFITIPLLLVRYLNQVSLHTKVFKNKTIVRRKIIYNLNLLCSNRRTYKIVLLCFILFFVVYLIITLIHILANNIETAAIPFIFKTIRYFLPFLIFFILSTRNQEFLSGLFDRLIKSRKVIILGVVIAINIIISIYFLAKPNFGSDIFTLKSIFSLNTLFYFSFSLVYYIVGFVFPFYQNSMYPYPDDGQIGLWLKISPLILLLLILTAFYFVKKIKNISLRKEIVFGLLFFLINIAIVLHIIPIKGRVIVAERYTYLAYLGLIIVFVRFYKSLILAKPRSINYLRIGMLVLVSAYSIQSYTRSNIYKNSYNFWSDVIEKNPSNHYAIYSIGLYYYENGDIITALNNYNKSIVLNKTYFEYYLNRGACYYKLDSLDKAITDYDMAVELNPDEFLIYKNRGIIFFETGSPRMALEDFEIALLKKPNDREISEKYYMLLDIIKGIDDYSKGIKNNAVVSNYYFNIGTKMAMKGKYLSSN